MTDAIEQAARVIAQWSLAMEGDHTWPQIEQLAQALSDAGLLADEWRPIETAPVGEEVLELALSDARNIQAECCSRAEAAEAKLKAAVEALDYYSNTQDIPPNEGPWGVNSTDFGERARTTLRAVLRSIREG